ncbi:MAG: hypothetical protein JRH20_23720 [Deltaproteobacteria bacterium]|nr:hypothetical protein [Deltaproteobacteria bacterium]
MIKELFEALNDELAKVDAKGEIGICGGAVMCLVFEARKATKDVDGIFQPTNEIRKAAKRVAERFTLSPDWLNDAAKAFFHSDPPRQNVLSLPNLQVWAPTADYMLAMKCISARFDSMDRDDVHFLIKLLGLKEPKEVFTIIERYYPRLLIPPKTQFLVEELLEDR